MKQVLCLVIVFSYIKAISQNVQKWEAWQSDLSLTNGAALSAPTERNIGLQLWVGKDYGMELHHRNRYGTAIYTQNDHTAIWLGKYGSNQTQQQAFTPWMTLLGGSVGIGTTDPAGKLHIYQSGNEHVYSIIERSNNAYQAFQSFTPAGTISPTNPKWLMGMKQSSADFEIQTYDGSTSTERLYIKTNGNVGIGSTSFNGAVPRFGVKTNAADYVAQLEGSTTLGSSYGVRILAGTNNNDASFVVGNAANTTTYLVVKGNGNVGIGTTAPAHKLDVEGITRIRELRLDAGSSSFSGDVRFHHQGVLRGRFLTGQTATNGDLFYESFDANSNFIGQPFFIKNSNGNVGIGTTTPQAKLAVNGDIFSKKVKVTQTGWPDYVFEPTYKLPSLKEVEAFIQQHKHLPDVPSAKEVEANGVDLGDNQATLLKKIEEQMLYILELHKSQEALLQEVQTLKKEIQTLKNK